MGLRDIFKTKGEIAAAKKAALRQAMRKLDRAVTAVHNTIASLKQKCATYRKEAYDFLEAGNQRKANVKIAQWDKCENQLDLQEKRLWLIDHYKTEIEIAEADSSLQEGLRGIAKIMQIKPAEFDKTLLDVDTLLGDQADVNAIYEDFFQKNTELSHGLPSHKERLKELESEIALSKIGSGKTVTSNDPATNATAAAHEALAKLREQGGKP